MADYFTEILPMERAAAMVAAQEKAKAAAPEYNVEDVTPEAVKQDKENWEKRRLLFARTLYGEARGEGPEGMEAVANVLRNRKEDTNYPSNYTDVIKQPDQFSVWRNKTPDEKKIYKALEKLKPNTGNAVFDEAYEIAGRFMDGDGGAPYVYDSTGGLIDADHYLNPVKVAKQYKTGKIPKSHWSKNKDVELQGVLGAHHFYKDKTRPPSGFNTGRDRYVR